MDNKRMFFIHAKDFNKKKNKLIHIITVYDILGVIHLNLKLLIC